MSQNHPEKPWRILTDTALISKLMGANERTRIYAVPRRGKFNIPFLPKLPLEARAYEFSAPLLSCNTIEVQPEAHIVSEIDRLIFWGAWADSLNAIVIVVDIDDGDNK